MTATKPYIGRRRARPGPSSEDYAERDYYCWRLIGSAMYWGLPYSSAIRLSARVFGIGERTAQKAYREHGGRPTTDPNRLDYMTPEPFETVEHEVLKHAPELGEHLKRPPTTGKQ